MINGQNDLDLKVVYNARQNAVGLLVDQFVLWYEVCYVKQLGGKKINCLMLESMVEFSGEWTLVGDF